MLLCISNWAQPVNYSQYFSLLHTGFGDYYGSINLIGDSVIGEKTLYNREITSPV